MIRGRNGRYLTAIMENSNNENENSQGNTGSTNPQKVSYILGANGQGIGEPMDCIQFINVDNKYVLFCNYIYI